MKKWLNLATAIAAGLGAGIGAFLNHMTGG